MSVTAICSNIFRAAGTGQFGLLPGPPGAAAHSDQRCPGASVNRQARELGDVMAPTAVTGDHAGEDLMTRRQVAYLFRVTSAAVATWARCGRLPEFRDQAGKPRYRRADVEALFRSGSRRRAR